MSDLIARSPIAPAPPVTVAAGWEVSGRRSTAALRLVDCTPLAKVLVRADEHGEVAAALDVPFGRAQRDGDGTLVVGSGPGEWLLLGSPGTAARMASRVPAPGEGELRTVVDFTDSRALVRLSGEASPGVLAKLSAVDLDDGTVPDGSALRTSVARVATDLVRDDRPAGGGDPVERGYLLHCERSSGQYLFDALVDAGREHGLDIDGFTEPGI